MAGPVQTHGQYCAPECAKMLEVLEHIEKAFPTEKDHKNPKACTSGGGSSKIKDGLFQQTNPEEIPQGSKALSPMQEAWGRAQHP